MIMHRPNRKPYSYDSRCEDLAEYFLADRPHTQRDVCELAQALQDTVEGFEPSSPAVPTGSA